MKKVKIAVFIYTQWMLHVLILLVFFFMSQFWSSRGYEQLVVLCLIGSVPTHNEPHPPIYGWQPAQMVGILLRALIIIWLVLLQHWEKSKKNNPVCHESLSKVNSGVLRTRLTKDNQRSVTDDDLEIFRIPLVLASTTKGIWEYPLTWSLLCITWYPKKCLFVPWSIYKT